MLTRDQILAPRSLATEIVPAPELGEGVTLTVRRLTAREFMELSAKSRAQPDLTYAHWITATVVDEAGVKVFTDDDAEKLGELPFPLIERLTGAAQRLSSTKADAAKNSPATQSEDSSTASH